jgi:uncharacterized protein YjiS (DUF1127 family)
MAAISTNTPAELTVSGLTAHGIVARVTAAVATARARAQARHDYRRLLDNPELMQDIGVRPQDVRKALTFVGGWM